MADDGSRPVWERRDPFDKLEGQLTRRIDEKHEILAKELERLRTDVSMNFREIKEEFRAALANKADKRVENIVYGVTGMFAIAVIGAIISLVIIKPAAPDRTTIMEQAQ